MKTLKELADIGIAAAANCSLTSSTQEIREAFAQAVKDAVMADIGASREVEKTEPTTKTFTAHGLEWTTHKPGDAMPCDGDRMVILLFQDGRESDAEKGSYWRWGHIYNEKGWRYADQPKTEPSDPYAELKAAHAEGKAIQFKPHGCPWIDFEEADLDDSPDWTAPIHCYRIKPWTLPTPPEGREWHRADWTEDMLPAGWRPLLRGEVFIIGADGDEYQLSGLENAFHWQSHAPDKSDQTRCRTRRPPPTPPKLIPLDITDIRATDEFKSLSDIVPAVYTALSWGEYVVQLAIYGSITYADLAADYLRRQHGSTEWKPCTKDAK